MPLRLFNSGQNWPQFSIAIVWLTIQHARGSGSMLLSFRTAVGFGIYAAFTSASIAFAKDDDQGGLGSGSRAFCESYCYRSEHPIKCAAQSPDGKLLALGDQKGDVAVFEIESGRELYRAKDVSGRPYSVALGGDGNFLAVYGERGLAVEIRDSNGAVKRSQVEGKWMPGSLCFSPKETRLVARSSAGLAICDPSAGKIIKVFSDSKMITTFALSSDGALLALGRSNGLIDIVEFQSGKVLHSIKVPPSLCQQLVFSPSNKFVAFVSNEPVIRLYDLTAGKAIRQIKLVGGAARIAFGPNDVMAVGNQAKITIAEAPQGKFTRSISGLPIAIEHLAFGTDGTLTLVGSESLRGWNLPRKWGVPSEENAEAMVPDRRIMVAQELSGVEELGVLLSLAFSRDAKAIFVGDLGGKVHARSTAFGSTRWTVSEGRGAIGTLATSADGQVVLSGSQQGLVSGWNAENGTPIFSLKAHTKAVDALRWESSGKGVGFGLDFASASSDEVALWRYAKGNVKISQTIENTKGEFSRTLRFLGDFSPDLTKIGATQANRKEAKVFALPTLKELFKQTTGVAAPALRVQFSPCGRWSLGQVQGLDGAKLFQVLDASTGREVVRIECSRPMRSAAFSSKGDLVAFGSTRDGGQIEIWNVPKGTKALTLRGLPSSIGAMAFSPSDRILAAIVARGIRVWELENSDATKGATSDSENEGE